MLRFPAGDRHATQATTHDQVIELVREIAPADALAKLQSTQTCAFDYALDGKGYAVEVLVRADAWRVQVGPGRASAAAVTSSTASSLASSTGPGPGPSAGFGSAAAASAVPAAPPSAAGSMEIERTQYAVVDVAPIIAATSSQVLDELLKAMKDAGASDLHLSTESPPIMRLHGEMVPMSNVAPFEGDKLLAELYQITPEDNRAEFEACNDTDFAYALPGVSRFRANMFRDRKGPGAVFRTIPFEMPSAQQLGLPESVLQLCNLSKGLVLVTGPTGSGKSTTLAALIDHINSTRRDHLITIEDPIEFIHQNKKCLVNQREVRTHTKSFKAALRAALREDPDIVLVGELRDLETIAIAVETAETGHLVFGTLHTTTAPGTVDRVIDQFPADRQEQIRMMLSESLQGVIAQVLCKKKGGGRVAAYEILLGSNAVSNLIREGKTFQLFSIMQTGRNQGMVTMTDSLIDLVKRGLVEPQEAYIKAVNKGEIKQAFQRHGIEI